MVGAISTAQLDNFDLNRIHPDQRSAFNTQLAQVEAYASVADYVHRTDTVQTAAFETGEFRVQSVEDAIDDDDETFLMRLVGSGLDPSLTITPNYAFVTIVDDDELPGAPTGLMVDNAGPTTVTLSWTAPSDEGSHTITGHLVERSTDSATRQHPTVTSHPPPYYDAGLTPETTYHYRVSAITAVGTGEPSETVSATTAALPVMTIAVAVVNGNPVTSVTEREGAPFIITRTGDTSEAVTVNFEWTQDGSTPIASTEEFLGGEDFTILILSTRNNAVDEPDGSITLTLKEGDGYTLGATTSATIIVIDDDEAPGAPVLSARPDNEQIELTWPKPAPGTSDITRYDYRRSDNNGVTWSDWTDTSVDLAQTMFSLTFENLDNGTLYSFEVRAVSEAGESKSSNTASATPSTGPTITAIEILSTPSLCDGRAYAQSEEVRIGVTFSEAVSVDATGGQPYLSLRMEGYDADAPYKEGSGTTQLVFARTVVVSGWSGRGKSFAIDDPAEHSARGLQLNGATIRSTANGNTAVLTGRSLGRIDDAHMIGVVMTGATVTSSPALGETYAKGERLTLTADFNAPIGTLNGPNSKLVLAFDSGPREAEYSHFGGNKVHYGYTITEGDADANGVGIPKDALNLNGAMFGVSGARFSFVPCNTAIEALSTDKVDAAGPELLTEAPDEPQTSVDGTKVVLHFDEMVSMTTAEPGAFTVTVDGTERGIDTVMADGVQVWLMLASAVATGEPVRVSYTDPSSADDDGAIQDKLSNDAGSFANQAVTNKVPASGAPGKPTGVTATATPTTVTVSWTAPTDPGTTAVTGYAVEWATNENGPWSTATADTGSTTASYTHTGQTPETSYHYRVAAINASGAGERSESVSATTPAAPIITIAGTTGSVVEGAFANFTLTRSGDTSEDLWVVLNTTQDGNFVLAGHITEFFSYQVGTFTTKALPLQTTDNALDEPDGSVTVKLLPGTGYTLGDATSATITVTDDDDPPGAPTLAVTPGNAQAALAWTAPSDTGSETISGYDYRVSDDATVTWDPDWTAILDSAPGETNAASYTVSTGLTNGTAYTFELRARNAIGAGPPSAQITITPSTTVNNAPAFPATETGMRTVVENTAAATAIGAAVAASDPDTADPVTYSLGGADASHFTIVSTSGQLKVGSSAFDYEAPADADGNNRYQVTVTASDGNGASAVLPVTVEVTDAASVKSVAITSTPADYHSSGIIYTTGETIEVTVTFSEAVTVDTTGGTPSIGIDVGGAKSATYKSGSGTAALVFGYDVVSSDTEQGGVSITANTLALNSATIKDADSNNAELGHGGLARDRNHRVGDMVRPVGFSLDEVPASNVYGEGVTLRLLGEFSQAVFVNGNNWSGVTIKMRIGGLTRTLRASGRTGTGNKFVIFDSYAIALNEVDNDGVEVLANTLAGPLRYGSQLHPFLGHGAWASDATIRIDGVYPRLAGSDPAVTSTDGTKIILTFTEAVSGTTAAPSDFTVTVSAMTRTVSAVEASDKTVVLTLSSAVAAGETITVSYTDPTSANDENAIQDIGGNDLESFPALAVTNLGPTGVTVTSVDLTSAAGTDETYAIGDVVTATVTLSEAVSLTGTPQLELDVGAAPKTADCALAADTAKLACTYTIVADDEATDGIAIGANKLTSERRFDQQGKRRPRGRHPRPRREKRRHQPQGRRRATDAGARKRRRHRTDARVERAAELRIDPGGRGLHAQREQRDGPDGKFGRDQRKHRDTDALRRGGHDQDVHARLHGADDQPHQGRGGEPRRGVQRGDRLDDRPDVDLHRRVRHDREREPGHRGGRRFGDRDRNDHQCRLHPSEQRAGDAPMGRHGHRGQRRAGQPPERLRGRQHDHRAGGGDERHPDRQQEQ